MRKRNQNRFIAMQAGKAGRMLLRAVFLSVLLAVFLAVFLTGCSREAGEGNGVSGTGPMAVAMIAGNHQNAQLPDYGAAEEWFGEMVQRGGILRIIVSDGEPYGINAEIDNRVFRKSLTESTRSRLVEENVAALKAACASLEPKAEENDTLEAIKQAAAFLAQEDADTKVLLIFDSGLSTEGLLNFAEEPNLLAAEPDDVVAALAEKSGIPDLQGTEVRMYLSEVKEPQQDLSSQEESNLLALWKGILQASGAADTAVAAPVSGSSGSIAGGNSLNWPDVREVESAGDTAIHVNLREKAEVFTEEELGFLPDSDVLADEDAAKAALVPVAEYMKANPQRTIIVMGSTASAGEEGFCRELSLKRAEKVAALLTDLGADRSQMKTLGLGYEDPWHVEDLDGDGKLVEGAAKQNRKVMILDEESPEADKL